VGKASVFWITLTYLITVHERKRQTDRITMAIPCFALKCIVQ